MSVLSIFRKKRTWLIILLLLILAPVLYSYVMMEQFTMDEKEINNFFKDQKMQPQFRSYRISNRFIYTAAIGNDSLPTVLFIHGAPGSWYDYIKYFGDEELISRVRLIAIDRPGYGNSSEGGAVVSIDEQAALISAALDSCGANEPVILVGFSYGGPIAIKMAMNNPDKVKALILLAPAIDPDNEKIFWVNKAAEWPVVRSVVPGALGVAQKEKMAHADELRKMESEWGKITSPVSYLYGFKDNIVPPVNVEYAKKMLVNSPPEIVAFPKENHFIPWTKRDTISQIILRYGTTEE